MLTEIGDTMGLVMLANGDDPSKVTDTSWNAPSTGSRQAVDSGQIRQFTGNDYAPLLAKGDVWAAMSVVGRHRAARPTTHIHWNVPKDGGDDLDRQHADPEGRQRVHRVGAT